MKSYTFRISDALWESLGSDKSATVRQRIDAMPDDWVPRMDSARRRTIVLTEAQLDMLRERAEALDYTVTGILTELIEDEVASRLLSLDDASPQAARVLNQNHVRGVDSANVAAPDPVHVGANEVSVVAGGD